MSKISVMPGSSRSVEVVLEQARQEGLDNILIIGWRGDDYWFNTSHEYNKDVLWDLELTKQVLLD